MDKYKKTNLFNITSSLSAYVYFSVKTDIIFQIGLSGLKIGSINGGELGEVALVRAWQHPAVSLADEVKAKRDEFEEDST